jgi:hypothetical protein
MFHKRVFTVVMMAHILESFSLGQSEMMGGILIKIWPL